MRGFKSIRARVLSSGCFPLGGAARAEFYRLSDIARYVGGQVFRVSRMRNNPVALRANVPWKFRVGASHVREIVKFRGLVGRVPRFLSLSLSVSVSLIAAAFSRVRR